MILGIIYGPILIYECISLYVRMCSSTLFHCSKFCVITIILPHINTKSLVIRCNIESELQLHCYFWKILLHYICFMNFIIFFEINADYVTIPFVQDLNLLSLFSSFYLSYQIFINTNFFYYNCFHFFMKNNSNLICCSLILWVLFYEPDWFIHL